MIDFGPDKKMWNDGPPMIDFMGVEGAPPVARKHLCYGGGSSSAGQPPDYSEYIGAMSKIGNQLTGYGNDLYEWAKKTGVDLSALAASVSKRAGETADWATGKGKEFLANWEKTYGPVYQAQVKNALDFAGNLPSKMESWAGAYGADVAQAFDASKKAAERKLLGQGLAAPSVGQGAIDLAQSNQRAAAKVAAGQQGRLAARGYSDQLTSTALNSGTIFPQLSGQQTNLGMAAGNQQLNAPESAVSTTVGAYSPSVSMYGTAMPYLKTWGDTMAKSYDQSLQQAQINSQQSSGWGALAGGLLSTAGQLGAAYIGGPMSAGIMGTAMGNAMRKVATGGMIRAATGGVIDTGVGAGNMVPPEASPTGGAQVDDVVVPINDHDGDETGKAAINVGEFIMPRRTVEWYGEKFMQNLVAKADKERQQQTVAEPEDGPPPGAFNPGQPQAMGAMA